MVYLKVGFVSYGILLVDFLVDSWMIADTSSTIIWLFFVKACGRDAERIIGNNVYRGVSWKMFYSKLLDG